MAEIVELTQAEYDALPAHDLDTLYVITDGADRTVLSGVRAPLPTDGIDGDFWINTATWEISGPKNVSWPVATSLIGPEGEIGPQGTQGAVGPQGAPGEPGPQPLGAWSPIATYYQDEIVTRAGSSWIATAESTGIDPGADPSNNAIGSLVATSPIPLGSPQSVAMSFTVDRDMTAVSLSLAQAWSGGAGGQVGIASAINVAGVGTQWLGSNPIAVGGRVNLNQPVSLSVGVDYWLVMQAMPTANIQIDQSGDLIGDHVAWGEDFWYGGAEPSNDFHGVYGMGFILFGTTGEDAWQLFVAKGDHGDPGTVILTQVQYDALTPKDPDTLYVITE